MTKKTITSIALVVALLITVVGTALAAERIINGTFETNVSGWSSSPSGAIAHETTTTHNSSSGSAQVTNASADTGISFEGGGQCADVPTSADGDYFTVRGWIYVPATVPTNFDSAMIRLRYYAADGCLSPSGSNLTSNLVTTTGSWQEVVIIAAVPAAGAESADIKLLVRKNDETADPYVFYDDVTFYDSNETAITMRSMTARSTAASPALLVALAAGASLLVGLAVAWSGKQQ